MSRRDVSDQQRERAVLLASIAAKRNAKLAKDTIGCQAGQKVKIGSPREADSSCQDPSEVQHAAQQPALQPALKRIGKRAGVDAVTESMTSISISNKATGEADSPAEPSPQAVELTDSHAMQLPDSGTNRGEGRELATDTVPHEVSEGAVGLELGENKQFKLQKGVSQILYDHQVSPFHAYS